MSVAFQKGRLGVAIVNMTNGEFKWGETSETRDFKCLEFRMYIILN